MKYKKLKANLESAQKWFDALPKNVSSALTRPGSVKQRTACAK